MRLPKTAGYFLHTALLLLVLAGVGNIHSHLCLDGQEAAVSVHFENLNGHPQHAAEEVHVDVDNELMTQVLPGKAPDQDSPLFLTACFLLFCLRLPSSPHYIVHQDSDYHQSPPDLLPPSRAPPHHSS